LIAAAAKAGAGEVILAAGGSATTDGGTGAVEALHDADLGDTPPKITVLCDVTTAWQDSPRIFAPQKGATPEQVTELEARLEKLAEEMPKDPRGVAMTGAAGGLTGGLWAWFDAELVSGASRVLDLLGFDQALSDAGFVLTGEGRLDASTAEGKLVSEVAGRSHRADVPCLAVVGELALDAGEVERLRLAAVREGRNPGELSASARQLVEAAS
jgi:glycerate kinase